MARHNGIPSRRRYYPMSETSLFPFLPPVHLLLLGYGRVAQAFLPLLASRSEWLGHKLGIRPVISGIGSRSRGFYIHLQTPCLKAKWCLTWSNVKAYVTSHSKIFALPQWPVRLFVWSARRIAGMGT